MKVEITLQVGNTSYDITEEYDIPPTEENMEGVLYNYTEGNFSCDCNKKILLNRHYGLPDDGNCGDSIRLTRLIISERPYETT